MKTVYLKRLFEKECIEAGKLKHGYIKQMCIAFIMSVKLKKGENSMKKTAVYFILGNILFAPIWSQETAKQEAVKQESTEGIKINGLFRTRPQMLNNNGFEKNKEYDFIEQKTQLNITNTFSEKSKIKIVIQDSRIIGKLASGPDQTGVNTAVEKEALDIREAYFDYNEMLGGALGIQLGRQLITYGDQRLVGAFEWSNTGRSFDALRIKYNKGAESLQLFSALMQEGNDSAPTVNENITFSGIYNSFTVAPFLMTDIYYLNKNYNDHPGVLNLHTAGVRLTNKTNKGKSDSMVDWSMEGAYQTGKDNYKDIAAYAGAVTGGVKIAFVRIGAEFDIASGDKDSADKKMETFNNLYPTNHAHYGHADLMSWRNMLGYSVNTTFFAGENLKIIAAFWMMNKLTEKDDWYNAGSASVKSFITSKNGVVSKEKTLYNEIDLTVDYKALSYLNLQAGFYYAMRSAALKDAGKSADFSYSYLMSTVTF